MTLFLLVLALQEGAPPCDVKTTRVLDYCERCDAFLTEKEDYDEKKLHAPCKLKPAPATACEKIQYVCPTCAEASAKPGKCKTEACEKAKLEKRVSRARVLFRCPGECGNTSVEAGKCTDPRCSKVGAAFEPFCTASGKPPHSR